MTSFVDLISQFGYIGIRHLSDDEKYVAGDACRCSYDWDYENDCSSYDTHCPVELPGTCALSTDIVPGWDDEDEIVRKLKKAVKASACYIGRLAIVAGDRVQYGADDDEIIIADAVVLYVDER